MKRTLNKVLMTALAAVILVMSAAGCGSQIKNGDVAAVLDGQDIPLSVANFYARYYTQLYYDSYMMGYYGDDMWEQLVESGTTYEESVKETTMDSLKQLYILDGQKEEYNVSLTDKEKEAIQDAAKVFMEENDEEAIEAMSASEDTVVELLTLLTVQSKMVEEITKDVDTKVSDEEAAQKAMKYVLVSESAATGDEEEEAEEQDYQQIAEDIVKAVKDGGTFEDVAADAGYTASTATFDSESTSPNADLVAAADELKEGEITEVIESEGSYYIGYLESEFDKDATESKKETIGQERKDEHFQEVYKEMEEKADFKINKKQWEKVSFVKQGVTYKVEEQPEEDGAEDENAAKDETDSADEEKKDDTSGEEEDTQ